MRDEALAKLPAFVRDGVVAGTVAAGISVAPSTLHALVTGRDPLEAAFAAGSLLLDGTGRTDRLLVAAVPVHLAVSLVWGIVLALVPPRRAHAAWGALAGIGIAALDLGLVGRRFPRIRSLPIGPQIADHVLYGVVAGAVLSRPGRRYGR